MTDTFGQHAWLERVLGVDLDAGGEDADSDDAPDELELSDIEVAPPPPQLRLPGRKLLPIWAAAKDDIDGDIDTLQRALREDGDEDLLQIADYGLHKVTEGQSVKLIAALRDVDSQMTEKALDRAYKAVQAFRDFVVSSPGVDVIEENPMGVAVPLRAKLGSALDQIEQQIRA